MKFTWTSLDIGIFILSCLFLLTVQAKPNTRVSTKQPVTVCADSDLLDLVQRLSSLEAAFKVQNEERQQMFQFFNAFNKVLIRLFRIENETDDTLKYLYELRIKNDVMTGNMEEMNRTVQFLEIKLRNISSEWNRQRNLQARTNKIDIKHVLEKVTQNQTIHKEEIDKRIGNIENDMANLKIRSEQDLDRNITRTLLLQSMQQSQAWCRTNYTTLMSRYTSLERNDQMLNQRLYESTLMLSALQINVSILMNEFTSKTAFCAMMVKKGFIGKRIIYDQVLLNEGSAYDNNTGIFTSRYGGLFAFSWVTEVFNNQRKNSYLTVNGKQTLVVYSFAEPNAYSDVTGFGVVRLSPGDQVYITVSSTYGIDTHQTAFCGWRV